MGKTKNVLLAAAIGSLVALGWCNTRKQNEISEKQERIDTLETIIKKDSINLAEKNNFLNRISKSYEEINSENKELKDKYFQAEDNLNKIKREKSSLLAKLEKFKELNKSANILDSLEKEIRSRDDKYDKLKVGLKKLEKEMDEKVQKYARLEEKYQAFLKKPEKHLLDSLEKEIIIRDQKYNELKGLYEKEALQKLVEQEMNSWSINEDKEKIPFDVKDKRFFHNLKFLGPRFTGITGQYIIFSDNNPENIEAFAKYESGRLIPLKNESNNSSKYGIFHYPHIDFRKGSILIYAIDKDGNKSKEHTIYILDGAVSKKKFD